MSDFDFTFDFDVSFDGNVFDLTADYLGNNRFAICVVSKDKLFWDSVFQVTAEKIEKDSISKQVIDIITKDYSHWEVLYD